MKIVVKAASLRVLSLLALSLVVPLVQGQQKPDIEEVTVTSHPLSTQGTAQSITVLSGDELAQQLQGSIGETVAKQAGVQSASFGAAVGRPVIHGLGGTRVKVMQDNIDTLDVSVTSADHATTVEPFIADQIEILKGASTLLYGSGAMGGVVDVHTGRIPTEAPKDGLDGKLELRFQDNADTKTGALRLDGKLSDNIAWHLDAFTRDADEYDIPGFAESRAQRALEEAEEHGHEEEHGDEEHEEEHEEEGHEHEEEARGRLPGSQLENNGGAFGLSHVSEKGFVGFSVSYMDGNYGLPGHSHEEEGHGHGEEDEHGDEEHEEEHAEEEGHEHEEEEGSPVLDMEQVRFDIAAGLNNPFNGVEKLSLRLGVNNYEHVETEGNGEAGTKFENDAWEANLLMKHSPLGGFNGTLGLQLSNREFSAIGEEAFIAPVDSDTVGLFWVGERDFGGFDLETGLRFEQVEHNPEGSTRPNRDFHTFSASLGLLFPITDRWRFSTLLDVSERAPSIEELYSNGPHLATQSFEVGNVDLQEESAVSLNFTAQYNADTWQAEATFYHIDFSDFIYQMNTGEMEDGLPLLAYTQHNATFSGVDLEVSKQLINSAEHQLELSLLYDTVQAELDVNSGNDNLPRIPASRYGAKLDWEFDSWLINLEYFHVNDQDDVADFELPTEAYDDLAIRVNKRVKLTGGSELNLFLHGRNLTDDEQRHHTSFIKDFAPAPGRRVEAGVRYQF